MENITHYSNVVFLFTIIAAAYVYIVPAVNSLIKLATHAISK